MSKKIDLGQFGDASENKSEKIKGMKTSLFQKKTASNSLSSNINLNSNINSQDSMFKAKLDPNHPILKEKKVKKKWSKKKKVILLLILLFVLGGLGFLGYKGYIAYGNIKKAGIDISLGDIIQNVAPADNKPQLVKDGDFTNTLIVGVDTRSGTGSNSGLENTDSIMIASYNHTTNKVALISVPRDNNAVFRVGKDNKTVIKDYRINAAYAIADQYSYPGGGLSLLRAALTEMTGLQINYTAQVNFKAFKDVIDRIGGITVNVENSFTDYEYPKDDDSGVMTVSFKAGEQTMNGTKALQYARSRHSADNGEGSDFMRAKRQQKVLVAVQEKLKSSNYITDPNALTDFIQIFGNNVTMQKTQDSASLPQNITLDDISAALALKDKVDTKNVISVVLDPTIGGLNSILVRLDTEAYMIGPKLGSGKYDDLKRYVAFVTTQPDLYLENRPGLDSKNVKQYAEIGFVDNGYGYSNTLIKANELDKEFISSTYMAQLKALIPLNPTGATGTTATTVIPPSLSGVGLYDVTQDKPVTKDYLTKKYNATVLSASQIPDNIKALSKDYDIILFFTKQ